MYDDKAVLIPLVPNAYHEKGEFRFSGSQIVTNEGAQSLFSPYFLPIFGKLNSYGELEDIEENWNTKAIEKFFDLDITEIAAEISMVRDNSIKHPIAKTLAGMFVHRGVWDVMSTQSFLDWGGKPNNAWDGDANCELFYEQLGFVFDKEDPTLGRYKRIFRHPKIWNFVLFSDGHFAEGELDGKKWPYVGMRLSSLVEFLENNTPWRITPKLKANLKATSARSIGFDNTLRKYRKHLKDTEVFKKEKSNLELLWQLGDAKMDDYLSLSSHFIITSEGVRHFLALYEKQLDNPELKDLVVRLKTFDYNMYSTNHVFMPTYNGHQHGNRWSERMLHETALGFINAGIAEWEKENKE